MYAFSHYFPLKPPVTPVKPLDFSELPRMPYLNLHKTNQVIVTTAASIIGLYASKNAICYAISFLVETKFDPAIASSVPFSFNLYVYVPGRG